MYSLARNEKLIFLRASSQPKYNFDQLKMALNESTQLEHELEKASTSSKTFHSQLTTHPKDVRKYDSPHLSGSGNRGEYWSYLTKIPIDTINGINKIAHDQLVASRDTIHVTEAQVDSGTIHATVLNIHAH